MIRILFFLIHTCTGFIVFVCLRRAARARCAGDAPHRARQGVEGVDVGGNASTVRVFSETLSRRGRCAVVVAASRTRMVASWVSRGARVARACSSRGVAMPRAMTAAWLAIDPRRVLSSVTSSAHGDDETPWRRRAEHHEATPRAPTWSTTALGDSNATRTKEPIDRVELENVARLANVRIDDVDATLEDVNGILRFVEALDGADVAGVAPMWSAHDAADGLRMRFDAAARRAEAGGEAGERELAALPRERALREAKYARDGDEFFIAPNSGTAGHD